MNNTVTLHRVLKAPPAQVYKAFIDGEAMVKWLPPCGFTGRVHAIDARVGGTFRMSFTHFASGTAHAFGGTYLEMIPGALLRYNDRFDDPNLPGEMLVTARFVAVSCGTELHVTQAGIPAVIPLEQCYLGWQDSLRQLAQLVEV